MSKKISSGTVHKLPADLKKALANDPKALEKWQDITPLSRNEWICWTTYVKKAETRQQHVHRVVSELKQGVRRPCCWLGCMHRPDKAISRSAQYVLNRQGKKINVR